MEAHMTNVSSPLPDDTYIDLVRSLYKTLLPTTIMAVSFLAVGIVVIAGSADRFLLTLLVMGTIAVAIRILVLLHGRNGASDPALDVAAAWLLERRFA
jgi:hypothetical protein